MATATYQLHRPSIRHVLAIIWKEQVEPPVRFPRVLYLCIGATFDGSELDQVFLLEARCHKIKSIPEKTCELLTGVILTMNEDRKGYDGII